MPQDIEVYIRLIASCCRQLVELEWEAHFWVISFITLRYTLNLSFVGG